MSEINQDFKSYVSSQRFVLTLSQPMIEWLMERDWHVRNDCRPSGDGHQATANSLYTRGLVKRKNWDNYLVFVPTEAGKHVIELLKIAGYKPDMEDWLKEGKLSYAARVAAERELTHE